MGLAAEILHKIAKICKSETEIQPKTLDRMGLG